MFHQHHPQLCFPGYCLLFVKNFLINEKFFVQVCVHIPLRPITLLKKRHQVNQFLSYYDEIFIKWLWCGFFQDLNFFADTLYNTKIVKLWSGSLCTLISCFVVLYQDNFLPGHKVKMRIVWSISSVWHSRTFSIFWTAQVLPHWQKLLWRIDRQLTHYIFFYSL